MNSAPHGTAPTDTPETSVLREAMVAELRGLDGIRTDGVADAFLAVPRHVFAPQDPVQTAYAANTPVWAKHDERGVLVSTVSAAHIQAVQLEQAAVRPSMRVLEIGSGGYNAALLAELVGPDGEVTTVDIDPEIIDRARRCLDEAGYHQVRTVVADGDAGVADFAPYDRIVVTVRSWDIPPAWVAQLAPDGRLVVPLRLQGLTRTVGLDRVAAPAADSVNISSAQAWLVGRDVRLCSFVPMQGAGAHAEPGFSIDKGRIQVRTDTTHDTASRSEGVAPPELAAMMSAAVRRPPIQLWSGVEFDQVDLLDLWLSTFLPGFAILAADQSVLDEGLLTPAVRIGAPTSLTAGGFAYRTKRPMTDRPDRFETGVLAWGPDADQVGATYLEVIRRWGRHRERGGTGPQITVLPIGSTAPDGTDRKVLDKTHSRIVLAWP